MRVDTQLLDRVRNEESMNIERLKTRSQQLKQLLQIHASNNKDAAELLRVLNPTLDAAIAGNITTPYAIGAVPCGRLLADVDMQQMPDIENAFAAFGNELVGGISIS
jgi:hypothetical protein